MIQAFIPIRYGSKSIPLKNIKILLGKPLSQWVINAANNCSLIDRTVISTDSQIIADSLKNCEVFFRSEETATDMATSESALIEFCQKQNDNDIIVFIQATSPFLSTKEIQMGIEKVLNGYDSAVSVVRQKKFIWDKNGTPSYDLLNRPRRQDWDGYLFENGAFYISSVGRILESNCRVSGKIALIECSPYSYFEIDEKEDWTTVEFLMSKNNNAPMNEDIKLVFSDVDGTLTDNGVYFDQDGKIIKKFNVMDGMGFSLLKGENIKPILITSSDDQSIIKRAQFLDVEIHIEKKHRKVEIVREICKKNNVGYNSIAYIGNDINDLDCIRLTPNSFAPCDSHWEVKKSANYVLSKKGGDGCVREMIDIIISNKKGHYV